jgi:hypothetical protein
VQADSRRDARSSLNKTVPWLTHNFRRIGPVTRVYFEKQLPAVEGEVAQMLADPEEAGTPAAQGFSCSLASTLKPIPNRLHPTHRGGLHSPQRNCYSQVSGSQLNSRLG